MGNKRLLDGKVAVITGAGRGIGKYLAKGLAENGAGVVISARTEKELYQTRDEIGKNVLALPLDVSSPFEAEELIEKTIEKFNKIDILINNAGIYGPIGELTEIDINEFIETININFLGTAFCTRFALKYMKKNNYGRIINLSGGGTGGKNVTPRISAYTSSKAAVVGFTESIAKELAGCNIFINAIAPGAINTGLLDEVLRAKEKAGEEFYKRSLKQKETGGDSMELALKLVLFLSSEKADGITGKLLSAKWDDYEKFGAENSESGNSSIFTLRRIDEFFFKEIKK